MQILTSVSHFISEVLQKVTSYDPFVISLGAIAKRCPQGAIAGALSRYYLTLWFSQRFGTSFPYGTFAINLSGAAIMGFFTTLVLERVIASSELRLLVAVGFLGSYTTFSTYALDAVTLLQTENRTAALFYWAGSAVLGVLSLEMGSFFAKSLL